MRLVPGYRPLGWLLLFASYTAQAAPGPLQEAIESGVEAQTEAAKSQQRIDEYAEQTAELIQQYRETLRQIDNAKSYNEELQHQLERQQEKLASFDRQLQSIESIQRNILPLMARMLDVLEQFIALDTPFLPEERRARAAALREMMYRPDVTLPDKFRRIMEAYQIEMDYGRNIEAYSGSLERDGGSLTVDFLRIGRVGLYYQTLDGSESGMWNQAERAWQILPSGYNESIAQGLKIARKQAPPDLFRIPVPAPEKAP
jgi:hypothetical protein